MAKIRVVITSSGAKAVQVVRYQNNRRTILKHIGSSKSADEVQDLMHYAEEWIKDYTSQLSIFESDNPNKILYVDKCVFLGVYYSYFYDQISILQKQLGYLNICHSLLNDLVIIRILEPASKLKSIELLEQYFGIQCNRQAYYRLAPSWSNLKEQIQNKTVNFARAKYGFDFNIVFYDITTLYFESFTEDELRKNGFSKDSKSQQPQILVALMVTKEGFPIAYDVYEGNTFEGHTIIPTLEKFIKNNEVSNITVVADAAMISADNINELKRHKINFIVGARLGNQSSKVLGEIEQKLTKKDGASVRIKTDYGYLLCSYSEKRYKKDLYEMNKQIEKAKTLIQTPSKAKKVKFTSSTNDKIELNSALVEKTTKLLGIKGYATDLDEADYSNNEIIEKYHELYKVEHNFRISKSDLQTRPIFHNKQEPIQLHILICFMALAISRHIELQTGVSIKKYVNELKKISDARMFNELTNKEIRIRAPKSSEISLFESKFNRPH